MDATQASKVSVHVKLKTQRVTMDTAHRNVERPPRISHWRLLVDQGLVTPHVLNYLVDAYSVFAASVLAGSSVLRSLFGAAFPLFTAQMYGRLGMFVFPPLCCWGDGITC